MFDIIKKVMRVNQKGNLFDVARWSANNGWVCADGIRR